MDFFILRLRFFYEYVKKRKIGKNPKPLDWKRKIDT